MVATGHTYDITGSYQLAFTIFVVLSLIATVLTFFLKPAVSTPPKER